MLESRLAPSTTTTSRSLEECRRTRDGGGPRAQHQTFERNKSKKSPTQSVGWIAVGGVGRPHGTLAVEGKQRPWYYRYVPSNQCVLSDLDATMAQVRRLMASGTELVTD